MDTDLDLDGTIDISALGPDAVTALDRVTDGGYRIGVVRDGEVVAVLIDRDDAKIFERLEIKAEEEWVERSAQEEPDDGTRVSLEDVLSRGDT